MGYTTKFKGAVNFDREVDSWLVDYINKFSSIRHMVLSVSRIKSFFHEWKDLCFKGNIGEYGQYFLGIEDYDFRNPSMCIVDSQRPPKGCPGLYCQWVIKDNQLVWKGDEKFYDYEEWLEYLIWNFFEPEGYFLNGDIRWQGENIEDSGIIHVMNNIVTLQRFPEVV